MVNVIRHHYREVEFFVPEYAYSAGTIFCMSGNKIHMTYSNANQELTLMPSLRG